MLTALRQQVQSVLYAVPASRKPALRRADAEDALFATDLPLIAEADSIRTFIADMEQRGWTLHERNGWLLLDAAIPVPEHAVPTAPAGECGCCISLLLRHMDDAPAEEHIRAVVKAADAGKQPFERLCVILNERLAAMLRLHQPLPAALIPYLQRACHDLYERRNEP